MRAIRGAYAPITDAYYLRADKRAAIVSFYRFPRIHNDDDDTRLNAAIYERMPELADIDILLVFAHASGAGRPAPNDHDAHACRSGTPYRFQRPANYRRAHSTRHAR